MTYLTTLDWLPQTEIYAPISSKISNDDHQTVEPKLRLASEINNYLTKNSWLLAARLIEQKGEVLLQQGLADVVQRWIETLPMPLLEQRPQLLYLLGACAWQQNQFYVAEILLERAVRSFAASGDAARQGKALVNLATCALILGDVERSQEFAGQALACSISPWQRIQLLMSRTWFNVGQGDWSQAKADFDEAVSVAQRGSDRTILRSLIIKVNPTLTVLPGGLVNIEQICRLAVTSSPRPDRFWQRFIDWNLAFSYWQRGRLEQALQLAQSNLQKRNGYKDGHLPAEIDLLTLTAVIHTVRGRYGEATRDFLQLLNRLKLVDRTDTLWLRSLYLLGRKHWLEGRLREAGQVYQQLALAQGADDSPLAAVLLPMMQGMLALTGQGYDAAERDFRQAAARESQVRLARLICTPRLMLAHLYLTQQRPEHALAELTPVLVESEQHNTPGRILQEGQIMTPLLRLAAQRGVCVPFAERLLELLAAAA